MRNSAPKRLVIILGLVAALILSGYQSILETDAQTELEPTAHEQSAATFSCTSVTHIPVAECEALVALYNGTDGPNWHRNAGWLATNTLCAWEGVTCNAGHVTQLNLVANHLSGSIPPELRDLANLQTLHLSVNQLSGNIPREMGNLANLQMLYLNANQLSGSIPRELGSLASLEYLQLDYNQLSGSIPRELGSLANLEGLALDSNQLSGSIPPELGNLTALWWLHLHENQLTGSVPSHLGNIAKCTGHPLFCLSILTLNSNLLSGPLPQSLTDLSLQMFHFNDTDLCEPTDPAFQLWLASIDHLQSTNVLCGSQAPTPTPTLAPVRVFLPLLLK